MCSRLQEVSTDMYLFTCRKHPHSHWNLISLNHALTCPSVRVANIQTTYRFLFIYTLYSRHLTYISLASPSPPLSPLVNPFILLPNKSSSLARLTRLFLLLLLALPFALSLSFRAGGIGGLLRVRGKRDISSGLSSSADDSVVPVRWWCLECDFARPLTASTRPG